MRPLSHVSERFKAIPDGLAHHVSCHRTEVNSSNPTTTTPLLPSHPTKISCWNRSHSTVQAWCVCRCVPVRVGLARAVVCVAPARAVHVWRVLLTCVILVYAFLALMSLPCAQFWCVDFLHACSSCVDVPSRVHSSYAKFRFRFSPCVCRSLYECNPCVGSSECVWFPSA